MCPNMPTSSCPKEVQFRRSAAHRALRSMSSCGRSGPNDMTATYTFDVFSSLDGYGATSGDWTGYWGKQGPELLEHRLALHPRAAADGLRRQHLPSFRADAGLQRRGLRRA